MNKYSDYFEIDEKYYPEINQSSIKAGVDWHQTYPHETFIDLLKATERMLARGTNNDKKGIWIEGAYGTGKSRVAWTLKNLLDCKADELTEYFDEYDGLKAQTDLRDRLLAHKKGKIVTAWRYSSSEIDGDAALIAAVYESITKALRSAKCAYMGENTLRGSIVNFLSKPHQKAFFDSLMSDAKYRSKGSFAGKNVDDLIKLLENPNAEVKELVRDILMVAKQEGISGISIRMDDLIGWLGDVIEKNDLKALVFVWDEFSSYFKNNRTTLDGFQKLVEFSNEKPFYMMIVTHVAGGLFSEGDQAAKIVMDRFVHKGIEIPDTIAFELIKHALKVKRSQRSLYEQLQDDLADRTQQPREAVRSHAWKGSQKGDNVIRGLLPIHPMAALLLKNISRSFASNQRSMFNFIKDVGDNEVKAFQWFIQHFSPDNGDILGIDYLWDFFYEKGSVRNSSESGRGNLEFIVRATLDTYGRHERNLGEGEKRVLKTILMMQAMNTKLGDAVELFKTTEKNLQLAFQGIEGLENAFGINLAKKLVNDGILYMRPGNNNEQLFAAVVGGGDDISGEVEKKKREIIEGVSTNSLVADAHLTDALMLTAAERFRYEIRPVTVKDFTAVVNGIANKPRDFRVRAVMAFARNNDEANKIRKLIKEVFEKGQGAAKDIVFIDASGITLTNDQFEKWAEFKAHAAFWEQKDRQQALQHAMHASEVLTDWKNEIASKPLVIITSENTVGINCSGVSAIQQELDQIVLARFQYPFDNLPRMTENVFKTTAFADGVKRGISGESGGVYQLAVVQSAIGAVRGTQKYWEQNEHKNNPLSKLKMEVDGVVAEAFAQDGQIAVGTIVDMLVDRGFMPCNLYALLTGFLLREYAKPPYRYADDEGNSGTMDAEKMATYLAEYFKHKNTPIPRYHQKYIQVLTQDQMKFVDFVKVVFGFADDMSIEQFAHRIRAKLQGLMLPIWCMKGVAESQGVGAFIDKILSISNPDNTGENVSKAASEIGRLATDMPTAAKKLSNLLTRDNAESAMMEFLDGFDGGKVIALAKEIEATNVLQDVQNQFNAGAALWLWSQETGENEIRKLEVDYEIVAASNNLVERASSLRGCVEAWCEKAKSIRVPADVLIAREASIKGFVQILRDVYENHELPYDKRPVFLGFLVDRAKEIKVFFEKGVRDIFKEAYSNQLSGFDDESIARVVAKLPVNAFVLGKSEFEQVLLVQVAEARKQMAKFKLQTLWKEATKTKSPHEWSIAHRTPILAMIPIDRQKEAARVFAVLNGNAADGADIQASLEFMEHEKKLIKTFVDAEAIDAAFRKRIVGRYEPILTDIDKVRSELEEVAPGDAYDWYLDAAKQAVENLAQSMYLNGQNKKALDKIEALDDKKLRTYLKKLIKDNLNLGIEILAD